MIVPEDTVFVGLESVIGIDPAGVSGPVDNADPQRTPQQSLVARDMCGRAPPVAAAASAREALPEGPAAHPDPDHQEQYQEPSKRCNPHYRILIIPQSARRFPVVPPHVGMSRIH